MSDWFNDPFFTNDNRFDDPADLLGGFHNSFRQMHEHMEKMMRSAFSGFGDNFMALGFDGLDDSRNRSSNRGGSRRSADGPRVEEPDDDEPRRVSRRSGGSDDKKPQTFFYSSAYSSTMGPDGIQQIRKKDYNSASGETRYSETRRLGDKSISHHRKIDRDGTVLNHEDRRNVDEHDIDKFDSEWEKRRKDLPDYFSRSSGEKRKALK